MIKLALFDWNGTLIDDAPVWYGAVKEIFRVFGKQPPTTEEYFKEIVEDYLQIYRSRGIDASREELNAIYDPAYEAGASEALLFSGVSETLKILSGRGVILGIVSWQRESLAIPLLNKFGLSGLFRYLNFFAVDINKEAVIRSILGKEKISPQECCFVGDAPSDVRYGNKTGVVTVAFSSGYISEGLLDQAGPTHKIYQFNDIVNFI